MCSFVQVHLMEAADLATHTTGCRYITQQAQPRSVGMLSSHHCTCLRADFCSELSSGIAAVMKRLAACTLISVLRLVLLRMVSDCTLLSFRLYRLMRSCTRRCKQKSIVYVYVALTGAQYTFKCYKAIVVYASACGCAGCKLANILRAWI